MIPSYFYIALIFLFMCAVGFLIMYSSTVVDGMKNNTYVKPSVKPQSFNVSQLNTKSETEKMQRKQYTDHMKMHQDHELLHKLEKQRSEKMRNYDSIMNDEHLKQHRQFLKHREQYLRERKPSSKNKYPFRRK